jgi:hypothetical protein
MAIATAEGVRSPSPDALADAADRGVARHLAHALSMLWVRSRDFAAEACRRQGRLGTGMTAADTQ